MEKITRSLLNPKIMKYASDGYTLDVGAGLKPYSSSFPNVVTLDINPKKKPDVVGDIHELPFDDNTFDVVLCTEVIEHVIDPQKAIDELNRVLKPGGRCVLTTRFVYPIHIAPHDYWRFTKYNLERMFGDWDIVEIESETKTFSAIAALLQRIIFQSKLRCNKISKGILLCFVWFFHRLNWLIVEEYSHIERGHVEKDIMTTGYIVAADKKSTSRTKEKE